jgi:hypothetical protein
MVMAAVIQDLNSFAGAIQFAKVIKSSLQVIVVYSREAFPLVRPLKVLTGFGV